MATELNTYGLKNNANGQILTIPQVEGQTPILAGHVIKIQLWKDISHYKSGDTEFLRHIDSTVIAPKFGEYLLDKDKNDGSKNLQYNIIDIGYAAILQTSQYSSWVKINLSEQ